MTKHLKVNLLNLPRPNSTHTSADLKKDYIPGTVLSHLDYAATFWVQHLSEVKRSDFGNSLYIKDGPMDRFLTNYFLEWIECLSLLQKLTSAVDALKQLKALAEGAEGAAKSDVSELIQDALRFTLRNFHVIALHPLQTYSSAVIFAPTSSVLKQKNNHKIPRWMKRLPCVEQEWSPLLQTLTGHSDRVYAVAFSPDGKLIASGSWDETVRLWDSATGEHRKTLTGHSNIVYAVAFSRDGKLIASGSGDKTVRLWNSATGEHRKTLTGHSNAVNAVAFSPDGKRFSSGSWDNTVRLWDVSKYRRGSRLGIYVTCSSSLKIDTPGAVGFLRFSADSHYLSTNCEILHVKHAKMLGSSATSKEAEILAVVNSWIRYNDQPILKLPPECDIVCSDVLGDLVVVGCRDGVVLSLEIDRAQLRTELDNWEASGCCV